MSTQTAERTVQEYECGWCCMSADLCLAMRGECCPDCTHYDEAIVDDDLDEVAVMRACRGDLTVTLNREEAAEAHRRLKSEGLSIRQIAERLGTTERTADRWNQGHTHPITRRGRIMTDTIDDLLAQAQRNPDKKIKAAADRANAVVQRVRDLLAEDAGKAEVRKRVERLERELREAKAALRGRPAPVQSTGGSLRTFGDGDHKCRNGCGKSSPNPQGRAAHERFCTHVAATA